MAKLTVVPTPVGNLEDMTFRAIRVLKEADLILAEDTRTTGILLKHFEIQNKMQSHHKFNEHKTVEQIASRIKGGENIALVSDAGTPAISDPGFMLVTFPTGKDANPTSRILRNRPTSIRVARNIQAARRDRPRNPGRGYSTFYRERSER